ncbi:MAG TPA: outer membrane lipoprotein chaperone LolA [Acidobacteriota bacterium]|nr:outer membrane lipoprotein chaperone LolA [Acidobacteriota bacterium]
MINVPYAGILTAGGMKRRPGGVFRIPVAVLFLLLFSGHHGVVCAGGNDDLKKAVAGVEARYAAVETVAGSFRQTYRAPGIEQVESGVFWMKRPGLMRWEYRYPEEKLFVADGKESFLYVPAERQVQVYTFGIADLRNTPLAILLGAEDINKRYIVSREAVEAETDDGVIVIRLTPRDEDHAYSHLLLGLDRNNYDIRRVVVREHGGNTSEFHFSDVAVNMKVDNDKFRFRPPRDAEVIRLDINN